MSNVYISNSAKNNQAQPKCDDRLCSDRPDPYRLHEEPTSLETVHPLDVACLPEKCSCKNFKTRHWSKNCAIHWWRRARTFNRNIQRRMPFGHHEASITLHTRERPGRHERKIITTRLVDAIRKEYKGIWYCWTWHDQNDEIHLHLQLIHNAPIDPNYIINLWKRYRNKYSSKPYKARDAWCKTTKSSTCWVSYMLGRSSNQRGTVPPWRQMTGRTHGGNYSRWPKLSL